MRSQIALAPIGLALAVSIFGGATGQAPVGPPPSRAESPAQLSAPAIPEGPTLKYERRGRRDPFEPIQALQSGLNAPAIAAAQLKGILRSRTPRVLVETADGLGYVLAVGDMLGVGRLIEIGADNAVFSVPPRSGSATERIVLRLPEA